MIHLLVILILLSVYRFTKNHIVGGVIRKAKQESLLPLAARLATMDDGTLNTYYKEFAKKEKRNKQISKIIRSLSHD